MHLLKADVQERQHSVNWNGQRGWRRVHFVLQTTILTERKAIFLERLQWLRVLPACPAAAGSTLLRHHLYPTPFYPVNYSSTLANERVEDRALIKAIK